MSLTLLTSGTTKAPKNITHSWEYIEDAIQRSIKEIGLTSADIVLDVFPGNTIAHYTVTAMPAYRAGANLISAKFEALDYLQKFAISNNWKLIQSWNGIYPKMTNGDTELVLNPSSGVYIINGLGGNGMTLSFGLAEEIIAGI